MDIQYLLPRTGRDTYRVDDSDDLVLMENLGKLPSGIVCLQDHSLFVFCTAGKVQFEYDGRVIKLQKNDLFFYLPHCVASNFMSSSDFNCRQIWLTRNELGNIDMYTSNSVSDLSLFKMYPIVHLTDVEVKLLDTYFKAVETCLISNCGEFAIIKIWIVEILPNTLIFLSISITEPVGDKEVSILYLKRIRYVQMLL